MAGGARSLVCCCTPLALSIVCSPAPLSSLRAVVSDESSNEDGGDCWPGSEGWHGHGAEPPRERGKPGKRRRLRRKNPTKAVKIIRHTQRPHTPVAIKTGPDPLKISPDPLKMSAPNPPKFSPDRLKISTPNPPKISPTWVQMQKKICSGLDV